MAIPTLFLENDSGFEVTVHEDTALKTVGVFIDTLRKIQKINRKISLNSGVDLDKILIDPSKNIGSILANKIYREEWMFLKTLASRSPFSDGLTDWLPNVELSDTKTISGKNTLALRWASICGTGLVSLNAQPEWLTEWIDVVCSVLNEDNLEIECSNKKVENFSLPAHADIHQPWLNSLGYDDVASIWNDRERLFPGIRFLPGVERQLIELSVMGDPYLQAREALEILSGDAIKWGGVGDPTFSIKSAAGEHDKRSRLVEFYDDVEKSTQYFGRHIFFTSIAGRIHFRLSAVEKKFVVAHVGRKIF